MARRRNADGTETEVPVRELKLLDRVVLKPGDQVPVDGEVTEGAGAVDESMLTGESVPVDKTIGDTVVGASMNTAGVLTVRATAVGQRTALAQIAAQVAAAQAGKGGAQRLADRVSAVFVPIVIGIAAAIGSARPNVCCDRGRQLAFVARSSANAPRPRSPP